jgi:hypothetical protein
MGRASAWMIAGAARSGSPAAARATVRLTLSISTPTGCQGLDNESGHEGLHQTVIHSVEEYVRGDVHTNTVEGAFGLFKRAIIGSFHQVSQIFRYSDEYEFRYNNRKDAHLFRDTLTRLVRGSALAYEQLKA